MVHLPAFQVDGFRPGGRIDPGAGSCPPSHRVAPRGASDAGKSCLFAYGPGDHSRTTSCMAILFSRRPDSWSDPCELVD